MRITEEDFTLSIPTARGKVEGDRMNRIIAEDMGYIRKRINSEKIDGSTVLISGATGLIGRYLVWFLTQYCRCKVIAVVRNMDKARRLWQNLGNQVEYIHSDITQLGEKDMKVDYMIHGASFTSSRSFTAQPVEVIQIAVKGTQKMLEFARKNPVRSFVYLSTMEVYGAPQKEDKIREKDGTNLDTMAARSSYPESKRLCENMCAAYLSEYNVPVRTVRLTQTFGPGVDYEDGRVFAEFARCVIEGKDIVLHTKGETKRNYLYLADACTAILTVMTEGSSGEAYNAANEETYCSIREMAEMVAAKNAGAKIRVRMEPGDRLQNDRGYAPVLCMNLDTSKLQGLGWKPEIGLYEMYERMIRSFLETVCQ